jgi:ubiquinone/menaquinone biosynthesis C-methylase UbiE
MEQASSHGENSRCRGVGETGFEAAAITGKHGWLITSDFSPAMLDAARRRGTELAIANVD